MIDKLTYQITALVKDVLRAELAAAKKAEQTLEYVGYQYKTERDAAQAEVERLREAIDFVLFNIHPSLTTEDVETIRAEMKRAKQGGAQ